MKRRRAAGGIVLALIAGTVVALDQYTKTLVRAWIPVNTSWALPSCLDRFVTLTHVTNTGAVFGLLPGFGGAFAIVAIVVVLLIVLSYRQISQGSRMLRIAFGLQLGGALGNLWDRLARGYVTDFVDLRWWPVFNVADSALVVGTILMAAYLLFVEARVGPVSATSAESTEEAGRPGD